MKWKIEEKYVLLKNHYIDTNNPYKILYTRNNYNSWRLTNFLLALTLCNFYKCPAYLLTLVVPKLLNP